MAVIRGIGEQGQSAGRQAGIASANGRFGGRNGPMSFHSVLMD
jgi:hypothetical protein